MAALVCVAGLVLPAAAAETENDLEDALAVFTVKGTHGYSMLAFVSPEADQPPEPGKKGKGSALVALLHRSASAVYLAPATVTADFVEGRPTVTSLLVNLGKAGQLSLDFKPSGGKKTARASCQRSPLVYAAGSYEGTVEFHGEQGFTDVSATKIAQRPEGILNLICRSQGVNEATGPRLPGAKLDAEKLERGPGGGLLELEVIKNSPTAKAHVEANTLEERGPVDVLRSVTMEAPAGAFSFDRRLRHARFSLGAPFAGRGIYSAKAKRANRWMGNLNIDLPGRANTRLTGHRFDVTLEHAVRHVGGPSTDRALRALRRFAR